MSLLSGLLGHNTAPKVEQLEVVGRTYNRKDRRNRFFVVKVGLGFVKMKTANPFTYDLQSSP